MVTYDRRVNAPADDDPVFKALGDRTRRALLDALFVRDGQTVQALCSLAPDMTRFGVMKHLSILEDAGLVVARRAGRTKQHFLNPVPIQQVADRWISKYAQPVTRGLIDLQTDLERTSA
ncbi:MAG: putative HTH-type transcriptional regulator YuzN [Ilumatobacteraceae bacterium]|nr:putative HTH-type transcriptional regulator YuzN [Ilumatobacteraceae bacterium]